MRKLKYLLAGFFLVIAIQAQAQQVQTTAAAEKDYARHPLWISMMNDTLSNYYEVEKAFTIYFQHHEQPEGEEDEINEHREREKIPSKRKQRKISAENKLSMNVKYYYRWRDEMLPYVQDNGRILTPSERLAVWQAQMRKSK